MLRCANKSEKFPEISNNYLIFQYLLYELGDGEPLNHYDCCLLIRVCESPLIRFPKQSSTSQHSNIIRRQRQPWNYVWLRLSPKNRLILFPENPT